MKANIGDVTVWKGEPPEGNPYRGGLNGEERETALVRLARGLDISPYTFWYAPCFGGARKVTAEEVNWETSGIGRIATRRVRCTLCNAPPKVPCRGHDQYTPHEARFDALSRSLAPTPRELEATGPYPFPTGADWPKRPL